MLSHMEETEVSCPFCGETITILVDPSVADQTYIEDCSVCCRPIEFHVRSEDGQLQEVEIVRS
jgi:hypothetical protein